MNPFNLYEAYAAVYDEDLREELEVIDEDLSFIDDLSDNELTQIMEEILRDGEVSLNECYYAFDEEVLTEARVTTGAGYGRDGVEPRKVRQGSAKVTYSKGEEERRARVGRKHAAKRLQVATGRAVERIRSGAESAKTKGAGAISAMAGGAAEAGRKGKAAAQRVGGKLAAAKERISGFVKRVGRAAGAGYKAAKAEFSGEAGREAQERIAARRQERESQRASRRAASSPFTGRNTTRRGGGVGRREAASSGGIFSRGGEMGRGPSSTGRALTGAPERKALPAAPTPAPESARRKAAKAKIAKAVSGSVAKGTRFAAPGGSLASQRASTGRQEALGRFRKKAGIDEAYLDMILDNILEEIIYEGYATDYDEALYVFEEIGMDDLGELAESYLVEEDFEAWVDGLWEEGYDLSDYTWEGLYEAYIEEARVDVGKSKEEKISARRRRGGYSRDWDYDDSRRQHAHRTERGQTRSMVTYDRRPGTYSREQSYMATLSPEERQKRKAENIRSIKRSSRKVGGSMGLPESYDAYDSVLEYLLDEGYAETVEDATTIMANMSEEWRDEIIDEANKAETMLNLSSRAREQARNLNKNADTPIFYKNRSMGRTNDPILNRAHKGMTATRRASHKAGRNLRGDTGEAGNVVKSRYQANKDHKDGYPSIRRVDF